MPPSLPGPAVIHLAPPEHPDSRPPALLSPPPPEPLPFLGQPNTLCLCSQAEAGGPGRDGRRGAPTQPSRAFELQGRSLRVEALCKDAEVLHAGYAGARDGQLAQNASWPRSRALRPVASRPPADAGSAADATPPLHCRRIRPMQDDRHMQEPKEELALLLATADPRIQPAMNRPTEHLLDEWTMVDSRDCS